MDDDFNDVLPSGDLSLLDFYPRVGMEVLLKPVSPYAIESDGPPVPASISWVGFDRTRMSGQIIYQFGDGGRRRESFWCAPSVARTTP